MSEEKLGLKCSSNNKNGNGFGVFKNNCWLPEEIWEIILLKYADAKDAHKFCLVSPAFNQFLHHSKPVWLFNQIFPHIGAYLKKDDVLALRLVCTKWCSAVNDVLENCRDQNKSWLSKIYLHVVNAEIRYAARLQNAVASETKCILPRKSVCLYYQENLEHQILSNDFIAKFGHQMLHLELLISPEKIDKYLEKITFCLEQCPNLISFELSGIHSLFDLNASLLKFPNKYQEECTVARFREVWPRNLEFMKFNRCEYLQASPIPTMCLSLMCPEINWQVFPKPVMLLKRQGLIEIGFEFESVETLPALLNFPVVNLTKIEFSFDNNEIVENGDSVLLLVYKILAKYKQTLQSLKIDIQRNINFSLQFNLPFLELPLLKSLILVNFPDRAFQSITCLRSLEHLHMFAKEPFDEETHSDMNELKDNDLDIHNLFKAELEFPCHEPYLSNMWSVFPKLREFLLGDSDEIFGYENYRSYRRDAYERHAKWCQFDECKGVRK